MTSKLFNAYNTAIVDEVGISDRISRLNTRSIKKSSKLSALSLALTMIDLTTLEGMDTPGKIRQLCYKARHLHSTLAYIPSVAAVCVYPALVRIAKEALKNSCHLFMEKPFTTSVNDAEDLIKLASNFKTL